MFPLPEDRKVNVKRRSNLCLGVVAALLSGLLTVLPAQAASAATGVTVPDENLIQNGGFEAPSIATALQQIDSPANVGEWRVTEGSVDVKRTTWQPAAGLQSLDLNGCSAGRIAQTVLVTAHQQYELRFSYAGNPGTAAEKPFHVEIDGVSTVQLSFDTSSTTTSDMGWLPGSLVFTPLQNSVEVAFASKIDGCAGPAIDEVSLKALGTYVPPPSTVAVSTASRGTGEAGATCGRTTFDWYDNTGVANFVKNDEDVCVFMLSNVVVQELLAIAKANASTLTEVFGELIAHELKEKGIEAARDTLRRYALTRIIKILLPKLASFISRASLIYTIAELSAHLYKALHALFVLDQIETKGAFIQITADVDAGELKMDWNLVYNPAHFKDPDGSEAHVWDRKERTLRLDELQQRNLGMSCTDEGLVTVSKTQGRVLKRNVQVVVDVG